MMKNREIKVIELIIENQKIVVVGIHVEPEKDKTKKESFFKKLENILKNNIKKEKIIMEGDANSVWED